MSEQQVTPGRFVSLRIKVLAGLTLMLSLVFAGAFGWFYIYSTRAALNKLQKDMVNTLNGAIAGVNVEEFKELAADARAGGDGGAAYQRHQRWLETVHRLEPRAYPYTYIKGDRPDEILFVGDILMITDPERGAELGESYISAEMLAPGGFTELTFRMTPYTDKWGSCVSVYAPITDSKGEKVGALGIDCRADYVYAVQREIAASVAIGCLATYAILFVAIWFTIGLFTRPILRLSEAATAVERGRPFDLSDIADVTAGQDEVAHLGRVFGDMVIALRQRFADVEAPVEERTAELTKVNEQLQREVAERKQAEEALRESEKRYALATNAGLVGVWDWDLETNEIYVDPKLKALLGYADHEIRNHLDDWGKFVHPDDAEQVMAEANAHLEGLKPRYEVEHRMLHRDGSIRWFLARGTAMRDANGKPYRVVGTDTDITERKQAEEALKIKDNAIASSLAAIAIAEFAGNLTHVNAAFLKMWGYDDESEVLGRSAVEFWQAEEKAWGVIEALRDGRSWTGELVARRKDGSLFDVQVSASTVADATGEPICMMASFVDITESKRMEEALRESEEKYRRLVETSPHAIFVHGRDGRYLYINSAGSGFFNKKPTDIIGKKLTVLFPEEQAEEMFEDVLHAWRENTTVQKEHIISFDGEFYHFSTTLVPIHNDKGDVVSVMGLGQDITGRKRIEEALRESGEKYKLLFSDAVDIIYAMAGEEGILTSINPAFANAVGLPEEEILGKPFAPYIHPDDLPKAFDVYTRTLQGESPKYELRCILQNQERIFSFQNRPLRDKEGMIVGIHGIARDITKRKQAEEALQRRAELERFITVLSTHFINLAPGEVDGEITRALQTIGEFVGTDRSYVCLFSGDGTKMTSTHEWCAAGIMPQIDNLKEVPVAVLPRTMEKLNRFETFYVPRVADFAPDGDAEKELVQAQDIQSFILVPMVYGGSLMGFLGFDSVQTEKSWTEEAVFLLRIVGEIFINALKRRQAEEEIHRLNEELGQLVAERTAELRESVERYRSLVEQIPAITYTAALDEISSTLYLSPQIETILGFLPAEWVAEPDLFRTRLHPDDRERVLAELARSRASGEPFKSEYRLLARDGSAVWFHDKAVVVRDEAGNPLCLQGVMLDITERKQAEEALERRMEQLTGLNQISQAVTASLELNWVLGEIVSMIDKVTDSGYPSVLIVDDEGRSIHGVETVPGVPPIEQRARPDGFTNWIIHSHQAVLVDDVGEDGVIISQTPERAPRTLNPFLVEAGIKSFVGLPLIARDRLLGMLYLHSLRPYHFRDQLPLLITFANQAAIAVENARLYEAERTAREQAEKLREATTALTSTLDLDQVLDALLVSLERVIPYNSASVFLQEGEWLRIVTARGSPTTEQIVGHYLPADDELFQEIRRSGCPLVMADAQANPNFKRWGGTDHVRGWMGVPLMVGGEIIGCLTIDSRQIGVYSQENAELVQSFANQAAAAIHNAQLFEQVRAKREQLQTLSRRLVEVQENERARIARELHDETGQTLLPLAIGLGLLEREADCPEAITARVAELKNMIKNVSENLHRLAMDLRPTSLDRLGLVAALRQYLEAFNCQQDLTAQFEAVDLDGERLSPQVETALYRIVQEALTNVIRHARANHVAVLLRRRGDRVITIVEDDGVGFDPEMATHSGRLGLISMRERVEALNGTLVVESTVGVGTTVFVEVPYVHSHPDSR